MSPIKEIRGSLFNTTCQAMVNTVGVMGAGLVARFKESYPAMFRAYRAACLSGILRVGTLMVYPAGERVIINFPTKRHYREPAQIEHIQTGLQHFSLHYKTWGIQSAAFPALGCGLGGLSWSVVRPVMVEALSALDILIEIYSPF